MYTLHNGVYIYWLAYTTNEYKVTLWNVYTS